MVCLHLNWEEVREDKGSYYFVYKHCLDCGYCFDWHTEDK